ncbi:hypothetical protein [Nitrobacter sp.]|uniref:hypothetical protein n=1 Tax=Nitrobacter sp. TaxID=29420 RepID=UPI001DA35D3F|nr:hypothetical protein [Nitrobacter sp.]MCB1393945.1 hypothetical protein [Nitrobacter sp.]MCV0386583.1 hypothetical protein [Nitrobacter sp.]
MADLVIAVDVGSSSARAGVFDAGGRLLARAEVPFATPHPETDHAGHRGSCSLALQPDA